MTEKHVLHLGKMSSISASDSESRFDLFVFLNPVTPAVDKILRLKNPGSLISNFSS